MPNGGRLIKTHEVYHPEYLKAVPKNPTTGKNLN